MNRLGLIANFNPDLGWLRVWKFFKAAAQEVAGGLILGHLMFFAPLAMLGTVVGLVWTLWSIRTRTQPRRRWRRLLGQPGLVACLSSAISWPVALAFVLGYHRLMSESHSSVWNPIDAYIISIFGGLAVAIAWATLALNRRWRSEATWLDRLGRLVGVVWVLLFVLASEILFWKPG